MKTMKTIAIVFLFLLFPVLGHSQVLVSYDKSEGVDFSKYNTYQIYSLEVTSIPEFEPKKTGLNLLIVEINKQMVARGYEKVSENPDLIINLGASVTEEEQTRETGIREAPRYIGQRNYHWESEEIVIGRYKEGTVTLDLVDTASNEMIWQAVASGILEKKQEKNEKKIVKVVKKLFKKYPVKVLK